MATPSPTGATAAGSGGAPKNISTDYSRDGREGEVEVAAIPRTAADCDDTDFEDNDDDGEEQPSSRSVVESLDLTGTLEEVNQLLGIEPGATTTEILGVAPAVGAKAGTAAGAKAGTAASAAAISAGTTAVSHEVDPTTAAVAKLAAARQKAAAASSVMDNNQSYDDMSEEEEDLEPEVGIEVQLEEPSLESVGVGDNSNNNNEAESIMGGGVSVIGSIGSGGIVIQEPKGEKTILPVEEVVEKEDDEEDDEVFKIKAENERLRKSNETLEAKVENVELREINETLQAQLEAKRRAGQAKAAAEPVQTATKTKADVDADAAAPTVTPEAVVAASGAAVAAVAMAAPAATPSDANANANDNAAAANAAAAPPAQKGPGLGVSKFADEAGNALDEFSSFVNTMATSVTEAVQPGLDSVRKTLNFGTASPSSPTTGQDGNGSVAAGAAAAVAAVAGLAAVVGATSVDAAGTKGETPNQATENTVAASETVMTPTETVVTPTVASAVTPGATTAATPFGEDNDTSLSSKASGAAKKLLAAFNCATNDTTAPKEEAEGGHQPVEISPSSISLLESPSALTSATKTMEESPSTFISAAKAEEDATTAQFLKEITEEGIVLLLHQAPNPSGSSPTSDWTQKIVRVYIKPGSGGGTVQPKVVWARNKSLPLTLRNKTKGMPKAEAGEKKIRWTSLDLLDIHSIMGAADSDKPTDPAAKTEEAKEEKGVDETTDAVLVEEAGNSDAESGEGEKSCFFTVTSGNGAVFVFEAMTPEERDRVSKGLQSVITGLAQALITGDFDKYVALVKDARDEEAEEEGELPSLRTPAQAMNDIAHSLLD